MKSKFIVPVEDQPPARIYWQDRHTFVTSAIANKDADRLDALCEKAGRNGKPMSRSKMVKHMILHCLKELE